jgi:hypothetical protein
MDRLTSVAARSAGWSSPLALEVAHAISILATGSIWSRSGGPACGRWREAGVSGARRLGLVRQQSIQFSSPLPLAGEGAKKPFHHAN